MKNDTWNLVPLPSDRKVVGCKWVLCLKENADGCLNKYKVCPVAKEFQQAPGFEFQDTFSPVVKPVTVHLVITIPLPLIELFQLDVNNVFL